ncbi:MAG: DUF1289 domain-containing protein [Rhodocyclaceae bacterium]|nr:DUF1289 domain-containing protein [Rhodocyclaceae bacterium]
MDGALGLCAGCLRTLDEIAAWSTSTDEQKRMVLVRVAQRREKYDPDGSGLRCNCAD